MGSAGDRASFSMYRAEMMSREPISAEAERDLAQRWKHGERDAGTRLIEACLPFVVTVALEYRRWGLPMEDIVQEGNIGLLKAADRFDPERGCRLATYAAYWIRAEIREFVARSYRIVRLGSSKGERRALRVYRKTLERDPEVLGKLSGLSKERAEELLPLLSAHDMSLDRAPGEEGLTPLERLVSNDSDPEEKTCAADERMRLSQALEQVVSELGPREQSIVQQRWLTEEPATLEALGTSFGVSKERVRQLEERAKKRMRARIEEISREPLAESA
ncbi:sigma-70 family RNA polymerase sigma factor [Chondromyces crocatus]|uniref:DNA-directed RNA polymerase sigma-70 factor n=1 Tax=Chondromyces crocatus TaxID=52 RepID=A0A0K1EA79_CHOCO|nr:sigma-70 family RNA polymerase sigma factor [Chondromyces crocatus]AKT37759.1 DNA-directed RNA polymerase sigma-70 factor [Chondromyces crocatus]